MSNSNKLILAQISVLKVSARTAEEYERIAPEIRYLESLLDDKNDDEKSSDDKIKKETLAKKMTKSLNEYNFFSLPKVNILSESSKQKLINTLVSEMLPFNIAMLDFLDFFQHLSENYFSLRTDLYKEVSKIFGSDKEGRSVKGNINSLAKKITENKERYTANQYKKIVIKHYNQLK